MLTLVSGLYIDFEKDPTFVRFPSKYFSVNYRDEWFDTKFAEDVCLDVDRLDISGAGVAGLWAARVPPAMIAGGTKSLLILANTTNWVSLTRMGENCYKWLQQLAQRRDIKVAVTAPAFFSEQDMSYGPVYFERSKTTAYTEDDFLRAMIEEGDFYADN